MKKPSTEYEIIHYESGRHIRLFFNEILYRNIHYHPETEITWVVRGEGTVQISGISYPAKENDIFVINANEPHTFEGNGAPLTCLFLQTSRKFMKEYCGMSEAQFSIHCLSDVMDTAEIRYAMIRMAEIQYGDEKFKKLNLLHELSTIYMMLVQSVPMDSESVVTSKELAQREKWISYIEEHIEEPVSLKALAEQEALSPDYLSHLFREQFGISFQEYVSNMRFEHALQMISDESLSITDISISCGFSALKYMNQQFLKHYGCSAQEFRKNPKYGTRKKNVPLTAAEHILSDEEALKLLTSLQ